LSAPRAYGVNGVIVLGRGGVGGGVFVFRSDNLREENSASGGVGGGGGVAKGRH